MNPTLAALDISSCVPFCDMPWGLRLSHLGKWICPLLSCQEAAKPRLLLLHTISQLSPCMADVGQGSVESQPLLAESGTVEWNMVLPWSVWHLF